MHKLIEIHNQLRRCLETLERLASGALNIDEDEERLEILRKKLGEIANELTVRNISDYKYTGRLIGKRRIRYDRPGTARRARC